MTVEHRAPLDPPARATPDERVARGKQARSGAPRSTLGGWQPAADRADPVDQLRQQEADRVPELVPIRHARMAASAFAFLRGAAVVMATDLAALPTTGLRVQLCGDAHLANFGGFASPERRLVFDVNDFDETHPGPFEWDVARLAASIEVAARSLSIDEKDRGRAVRRAVGRYRTAMRELAGMTDLDVWTLQLDADRIAAIAGERLGQAALTRFEATTAKAKRKDRFKALSRLTEVVDGELRFVDDPPLVVPVEQVLTGHSAQELTEAMRGILASYRRTLPAPSRRLLDGYRYRHLARKVVGVGSVGTRCWVMLLTGRGDDDPLFLQIKEAGPSVLEPAVGRSEYDNSGHRVVAGQGLMQSASDRFLGWDRVRGADGVDRDYYLRQLWDWKASADIADMTPEVLALYGALCGWTLARAHACTGDRIAIAAYLGTGDTFDRSLAAYAAAAADQNELDHMALVGEIASGRLEAQTS